MAKNGKAFLLIAAILVVAVVLAGCVMSAGQTGQPAQGNSSVSADVNSVSSQVDSLGTQGAVDVGNDTAFDPNII
jgi:hypothetical protein